MGNCVTIQFTKFEDIDHTTGDVLDTTYGYRIYDNYAQVYNNDYQSFDELKAEVTKATLLDTIRSHEEFSNAESSDGVMFNGNFYEWGELDDPEETDEAEEGELAEV